MEDKEFGRIEMHLDRVVAERQISLKKLSYRAEIQPTQLKKYYSGDVQRPDFAVLCRLCYALQCDLHDIMEYIPPKGEEL